MKAKKFSNSLKKWKREADTNKIFTGLSLIVLILSVAALNSGGLEKERNFSSDSVRVIDGDTVEASVNNSNVTVRFLGVDTPETQTENAPREFNLEDTGENRNCLKRWGEKAAEYVEVFTGSGVRIKTDKVSENRGDYGRLLAYIEKGNKSLNEELLRKGYGRVYESDFTQLEKYRGLEDEARRENIGVWSC